MKMFNRKRGLFILIVIYVRRMFIQSVCHTVAIHTRTTKKPHLELKPLPRTIAHVQCECETKIGFYNDNNVDIYYLNKHHDDLKVCTPPRVHVKHIENSVIINNKIYVDVEHVRNTTHSQ